MPSPAGDQPAAARLLADLVAIPSPSGREDAVADFVVETARGWGLDVESDDAGVRVEVAGPRPGPSLGLVTHLDTVPPGEGWSRDPLDPAIEEGRLYGRGSGDAKASVAAMLLAARDVAATGGPPGGRLVVVLGRCEETEDTTIERAIAAAGPLDAAVVGEPTNLDLAVAQRGLLRLDLVARGDQRHAGRAGGEPYANAIERLARDLLALEGVAHGRPHPLLGDPAITPTMLEAGVARNITPPVARAALDVRSTPPWPHAGLLAAIRAAVDSEVVVVSDRHVPRETPPGSRLVAAARRVRPGARLYGSPTSSDWAFLDGDAVKCGPGTSARSHTPDECVEIAEVAEARRFFAALARAYPEQGDIV